MIQANNLEALWYNFDTTKVISPDSPMYVKRIENCLRKLAFDLRMNQDYFHGFLCGHIGSGKTTELLRLKEDAKLNEKYLPIYLSISELHVDRVHLTHDALMVEMANAILEQTDESQLNRDFAKRVEKWGLRVTNTMIDNQKVLNEIGAKPSLWLAYFKSQLASRVEWNQQQKQTHEPKVLDLIEIVNQMATDFHNKTKKHLLVMVDDLEKGESDADKKMHHRIFNEQYNTLIQPQMNIIYTMPVYFRGLTTKRVEDGRIYSFSSIRLFDFESKSQTRPTLAKDSEGYALISDIVKHRVADVDKLFARGQLDELIRIGGGLLRETARGIREATYHAITRESAQIEKEDVDYVFNKIKKDFQPQIRGKTIDLLKAAAQCDTGWIEGIEPYLQSGAVVEYENGNIWLDVRYPLKSYVLNL